MKVHISLVCAYDAIRRKKMNFLPYSRHGIQIAHAINLDSYHCYYAHLKPSQTHSDNHIFQKDSVFAAPCQSHVRCQDATLECRNSFPYSIY